MAQTHDQGRWDWLVELAGATVPAAAAAFAATKLAPVNGWPLASAVLASFAAVFAVALAAMRFVPAEARRLGLPDFEPAVDLGQDLHDEPNQGLAELLLDQPLIAAGCESVAELLLDDPLPAPTPDSRVVQLFAEGRMPTAGQLRDRIDRHLADGPRPALDVTVDAADALSDALAELRRSMRQA